MSEIHSISLPGRCPIFFVEEQKS
uniref:Uncharacterized protein n=1 Tax=Rhizophora mucronata TaxID=61149 RepID=A0A2P2J0Q2_RHIMU